MDITFKVENQFVERTDYTKLVARTTDYIYAEFIFSTEWEGFEKTAQFTRDTDTYNVLIVDDKCKIPWEIMQTAGRFTVSVFGGDLFTTSGGKVNVAETGYIDDGSFPADPTPSYFEDIVLAEDERVSLYNSIQQQFEDGDFTGEAGEQGNGIVSIIKTGGDGSAGTTDTYTITFTDTTTTTFQVYNGVDGELVTVEGEFIGDMTASIYDPTNVSDDVFDMANMEETTTEKILTADERLEIAKVADKVDNSQILTDVPSNALFTDTVYTHPDNHAISIITGLQGELDGKVDDGQVLTDVPAGALFTDTDTDTTYSNATTSTDGLMAKEDKTKLDGTAVIEVVTDFPASPVTDVLYIKLEV